MLTEFEAGCDWRFLYFDRFSVSFKLVSFVQRSQKDVLNERRSSTLFQKHV